MTIDDTFTDRFGTWIVTYVASDGSGFESELVR